MPHAPGQVKHRMVKCYTWLRGLISANRIPPSAICDCTYNSKILNFMGWLLSWASLHSTHSVCHMLLCGWASLYSVNSVCHVLLCVRKVPYFRTKTTAQDVPAMCGVCSFGPAHTNLLDSVKWAAKWGLYQRTCARL